jgi:hypothetical protein
VRKRISHIFPGLHLARARRIAIALLLLFTIHVSAETIQSREYHIKAVFLYNFSQFVEWPEEAFETPSSPFIIGILGEDPFKSVLDETVAGEKVKDHPIIIQRYPTLQDLKSCHILFIGNKEAGNVKKIVDELKNKNILTVSDIPGFAEDGGMIRFIMHENKTKLQINPGMAKAAALNISSKLLRLADIVEP